MDKDLFNDEWSRENTIGNSFVLVVILKLYFFLITEYIMDPFSKLVTFLSYFTYIPEIGKIDRNSPFFNMIIPNRIVRKLDPVKWKNLQINQDRLISPLSANRGLVELLEIEEFYTHNDFEYSLLGDIPGIWEFFKVLF